ncbi:hypothetical protein AMD27_13255 [Acinetobacter sp. TGL-Y2]|uniref:helix-turn-helix domain-containing protein n=1 Tax=Acinetobacter sp. TGL-Y2 TaxID=1407071 RepID=UPI0007A67CE6|nr:helix-turn-helix transcriptional regulator [Acinetobacter sp. TGL-Y2]AMW79769.1 hypothetical protein AMD27_13255 [Acinetobacter sp. TGL-Y2]
MNDNFSTKNRANRLKEERKRLKLLQVGAAEIVDVREASWIRYEKHGDPLNQDQIYALANVGFDMSYVLFGEKENINSKNILTELYELVADDQKEGLVYLAKAFVAAYPKC